MNHLGKFYKNCIWLLLFSWVFSTSAFAVIPDTMDYQGYLTDNAGAPINSHINMTFSIYNVDAGGIPLWSDTQTVIVNNGLFNAQLGRPGNLFPLGLFDSPLWLGVSVSGDAEMIQRKSIDSTAFAQQANNALSLDGVTLSGLVLSSELTVHNNDPSAHHNKTTSFTELTDMAADTQLPATIARDSEIMSTVLANDGSGSTLDADTIDGVDSVTLEESAEIDADIATHATSASAHHAKTTSFSELTDTAADTQLPASIARDNEIIPTVLAGDGPGSTLDADFLDGFNSTAFMHSGTDLWVNTTGDSMTGGLNVLGKVGIGTTTPLFQLSVSWEPTIDNINPVAIFQATGNTNSAGAIRLQNTSYNGYNIGITVDDKFAINYNNNISLSSDLFRITPGGNVGIGILSPARKLSVAGTIESTSGGFMFPDGTVQSTAANDGYSLNAADGDPVDALYVDNAGRVGIGTTNMDHAGRLTVLDDDNVSNTGGIFLTDNSTGFLSFSLANGYPYVYIPSERGLRFSNLNNPYLFYIGHDKRIGIGTGSTHEILTIKEANDGGATAIDITNTDTTSASTDEQVALNFRFTRVCCGGGDVWSGRVVAGKENAWDSTENVDSYLAFWTTLNSFASEQMRITGQGNVGIGTVNPSYKLHVNGSAAGTSWTNISSREYKEEIRRVEESEYPIMLASLMDMQLTTYKYKKKFGGDDTTKLGFIAEEMPKEVLSKDGKGIDLYELLSMTIGAMKAQQEEIWKQAEENQNLKARLARLEKILNIE